MAATAEKTTTVTQEATVTQEEHNAALEAAVEQARAEARAEAEAESREKAVQPTRGRSHEPDDETGLHIKDDWKAEGMYALFDGERLITRSANRASLERAKSRIEDQIKAGGGRPFSSRVAPVETRPDTDDADDGPPRKTKRASWAE